MSTGMIKFVSAIHCTECLLGKMKEKPNNTPSQSGEYLLEYIYIEIAGFFLITSYNRCQY